MKVCLCFFLLLVFFAGCKKDCHNNSQNQPNADYSNSFQVPVYYSNSPIAQFYITQKIYNQNGTPQSAPATQNIKSIFYNNQNAYINQLTYQLSVYSTLPQSKNIPVFVSAYTINNLVNYSSSDSTEISVPTVSEYGSANFDIELIKAVVNNVNLSSVYSGVYSIGNYVTYKLGQVQIVANFSNSIITADGSIKLRTSDAHFSNILGTVSVNDSIYASYKYADSIVVGLKTNYIRPSATGLGISFQPVTTPFALFDSLVVQLSN